MLHCLRIEHLVSVRQGRALARQLSSLCRQEENPGALKEHLWKCVCWVGTCRCQLAGRLTLCYILDPAHLCRLATWLSAPCEGQCHPLETLGVPFESCWQQCCLPRHQPCQCQKNRNLLVQDLFGLKMSVTSWERGHFCSLQISSRADKAAGTGVQNKKGMPFSTSAQDSWWKRYKP